MFWYYNSKHYYAIMILVIVNGCRLMLVVCQKIQNQENQIKKNNNNVSNVEKFLFSCTIRGQTKFNENTPGDAVVTSKMIEKSIQRVFIIIISCC